MIEENRIREAAERAWLKQPLGGQRLRPVTNFPEASVPIFHPLTRTPLNSENRGAEPEADSLGSNPTAPLQSRVVRAGYPTLGPQRPLVTGC